MSLVEGKIRDHILQARVHIGLAEKWLGETGSLDPDFRKATHILKEESETLYYHAVGKSSSGSRLSEIKAPKAPFTVGDIDTRKR